MSCNRRQFLLTSPFHFRRRLGVNIWEVAGNRFQQIRACDDALDAAIFINDHRCMNRRFSKQIESSQDRRPLRGRSGACEERFRDPGTRCLDTGPGDPAC